MNEYADYIDGWIWQWFVTLTLPEYPRWSEQRVNKLLKNWTRKLCTEEHLQVGYVYSLVYKDGHPHLHLLMLGRNRFGKTLGDVDMVRWTNEWPYRAKIELPESNAAVSYYFEKNRIARNSDWNMYNVSLLNRHAKHGLYNPVGPAPKLPFRNKCHLTHTRIRIP